MASVDSTSDERTVNNTMRHAYPVLSDAEKANMQAIKDEGLKFHDLVAGMGASRELSPRQDQDRGSGDVGCEAYHGIEAQAAHRSAGTLRRA